LNKAKKAPTEFLPVAAVSMGLEGKKQTDFSALKEAGAVAFSDDGEPVSSAQLMSEAMKASSWLGVPLLAHCEDKSLAGEGIMNLGVVSEMLGVPGIPASSEVVGVAREIAWQRHSMCLFIFVM
jgi:dihydroorotase